MSKKIIAVAAAAALALTGLVGVAPANSAMPYSADSQPAAANSLMVTSTVASRSGAGTLADPYKIPVPQSGLATSGTTLRFAISTTAARAVTVTATSGIRLVATVTNTTPVVLTGADSLTVTADASGAAEFRAYPTSTTRGVVTITNDGDITQIYVTGTAGTAYDIGTVTLPSMEPSGTGVVVAVVTDAFGNATETGTLTASLTGTGSPTAGDITYSTTAKRWQGTQTAGATAGQLALGLTISGLTATDAQKAAFGAPTNTYFGIITVTAAKTVTELNASIATLTASVAALTADYNALATKYNKLVKKSKRVAKK